MRKTYSELYLYFLRLTIYRGIKESYSPVSKEKNYSTTETSKFLFKKIYRPKMFCKTESNP